MRELEELKAREDGLLPCPFCGEKPNLSGKLGRYSIFHQCDAVKTVIGVGQKKEVIKKWNTRADNKALSKAKAKIEYLTDLLEYGG